MNSEELRGASPQGPNASALDQTKSSKIDDYPADGGGPAYPNDYVYLLSCRQECHWLARKIVHDGRDPFFVAEAMVEKIAQCYREYQELWRVGHEGL